MATKSKLAGVVLAVAAAGIVTTVGVDKAVDTAREWLAGGTEIIGEGDSRIMVSGDTESDAKKCTAHQILADRQCEDFKVVIIDAARMPFIGRNVSLAWQSGLEGVLTMNRSKYASNRRAACSGAKFKKKYQFGSCDEYPMASTDEGGARARIEEVPKRENDCQGGTVVRQYPRDSEKFLVVIAHPDKIAQTPYAGVDIAEDQACQG